MSAPALSPDLIRRAQQSDPQAISAIYERYAPEIYRYIYYRVHDAELARDLQSDVFLRMIEGLGRYEDRGWSISAWLYRIAHDRLIDTLRRRERTHTIPLDAWVESGDDHEDSLELSAQRAMLRRAISQLSPSQAQVLRLRYGYDLSIQETARQMGRSQGSIKSLQHRAQQNLARLIQEDMGESPGGGYSFA
ncbi:sigma-70 family RNA polymerase sigma factor [Oscillochloris sp. ZM17-4]|uniref:sigma-70 family RNA polymerase sigma factor n=1 Tax=Oscillochloris sp. ZM17-4 TaxID=2866714 RepID=UPI001C72FF53|nr:sigma-70 family RNA polymerase sigma factor [Oscillochloris sp. ZM17-4]MBX0327264.1 sigma-70 family RNA polymerase sigma factor [Oscillochloris sp. ZM17-4]